MGSKALLGAFIATQAIVCCYASEDSKINLTEPQFKKLQSKLAYIDYAITANNAIALEENRTKWYTKLKYRKSVINEIGHAIEKCLLGNMYDHGIVIFYENMDPKGFTQANYNAWLLYNYVDHVIRTNKDVTLNKVASQLKTYTGADESKLQKAMHDIGEYLRIKTLQDAIKFYHGHDKKHVNILSGEYLTPKHLSANSYTTDMINGRYRSKCENPFNIYSNQKNYIFNFANKEDLNIDFGKENDYVKCILKINPLDCDIIASFDSLSYKGSYMLCCDVNSKNQENVINGLKLLRSICYENLLINCDELTDYIMYEQIKCNNCDYKMTRYKGKSIIISGQKYNNLDPKRKDITHLEYKSEYNKKYSYSDMINDLGEVKKCDK